MFSGSLINSTFCDYNATQKTLFPNQFRLLSIMPTILREGGFHFKINTDDHEPMHVHVWHQSHLLIVNFETEVVVRNSYGFNNNEARRAVRIVEANQTIFQAKWREIHR